MPRSNLAERLGIDTGLEGTEYPTPLRSILITEANRATTFEYRRSDVELLQKIAHDNYNSKGVAAAVFGLPNSAGREEKFKFAVYVQSGFLVEIEESA